MVVTTHPRPEATSRSVTWNQTSETCATTAPSPLRDSAANLLAARHYRLGPCSTSAASAPNPTPCAPGSSRRGGDAAANVDRILELDVQQRALGTQRDELRARVKVLSKEVGQRRGQGDAAGAEALMAESRALGDEEKALDVRGRPHQPRRCATSSCARRTSPPTTAPTAPARQDNVVLRIEGFDPDAYGPHQRVPHWDIGTELGILDGERAAKIAGSMFTMYRGWGARLLRAMVQLSLDRNADAYEEIRPPTLVRTDTMIATGHLPKFDDEAYHIERDDLWAIPTAEVPLTSLHRDEVLDEVDLPLRYTAHTSCFRREAGAAGRDTRGLLRVHEFDKVELLAVANGADAGDQVPGGRPRPQRVAPHRARAAVSHPRPLHRRHRRVGRPHVGHRGLRARAATCGSR